MVFDWQLICALGVVMMATAFLLRRLYLLITSKATSDCGSCPNKPTAQSINAIPLVQLQVAPKLKSQTGNAPSTQ